MNWQKADALQPETYTHLLNDKTAVVHTMGTLLEDSSYKAALNKGDLLGLVGAATGLAGTKNPLEERSKTEGYDMLNRDAGVLLFIIKKPSCLHSFCNI